MIFAFAPEGAGRGAHVGEVYDAVHDEAHLVRGMGHPPPRVGEKAEPGEVVREERQGVGAVDPRAGEYFLFEVVVVCVHGVPRPTMRYDGGDAVSIEKHR